MVDLSSNLRHKQKIGCISFKNTSHVMNSLLVIGFALFYYCMKHSLSSLSNKNCIERKISENGEVFHKVAVLKTSLENIGRGVFLRKLQAR